VNGKKILFVEEMQGPGGDTKWTIDGLPGSRWDTKAAAEEGAKQKRLDPSRVMKVVEGEQGKMPPALQSRIYDIGVKRVLALAKEKGYDGVAWTTGEMQADRYHLSKYLNHMEYMYNSKTGLGTLDAFARTGMTPVIKETCTIEQLPQFIGKEAANKLVNQLDTTKMFSFAKLKDEEIKVGGEGLKSVYDKTLPEKFKKYGKEEIKKLEIPLLKEMKVEQTDTGFTKTPIVDNVTVPYIPITEKTPSRYPIYSAGPVGAIMKMLQEEKEKGNAQSTYHR
jgi:hypothetical protein